MLSIMLFTFSLHASLRSRGELAAALSRHGADRLRMRAAANALRRRLHPDGVVRAPPGALDGGHRSPPRDDHLRRSEEHTSELQSIRLLVCLLLHEQTNNE